MFDLTGKRALVCGASQGIGRAAAERLASTGAQVTLLARNERALREACAQISGRSKRQADFCVADTSEPQTVRGAAAEHCREYGPFQILVNNTGGPAAGALLEAESEQLRTAFRMHVVCNQLLVQTLVPGMKQAGYGRIVNIVSTSVREPIPGLGVSNTIRAAVAGWAKTLSRELGPFGITINNVLPGYTATTRLQSLIETRARQSGSTPQQIEEQMKSGVPLGRFADPDEIAAAVVFLASPAASYITGVSLAVDGGRTASI